MDPIKWFFVYLFTHIVNVSANSEYDDLPHDEDDVSDETHNVQAVLAKTATLPCDIESKDRQNVVYMVLWFKHNDDKPIYRFDARGRSAGKELHWSDERSFGPRAYFITQSRPASLQLDNVQLQDEDTYRCRVDYRNAPTRNFRIHLTVIVPPHQIILYDGSGREIQNIAGPFFEGDDLSLICEVRGGKPASQITWHSKGEVLHNVSKIASEPYIVTRKLEVRNLTRSQDDNFYSCSANNSHLITPLERTVQVKLNYKRIMVLGYLDMNIIYVKPLFVNILKKYTQMVAHEVYSLTCEAKGSKPPAVITWWKDDKLMNVTKLPNLTEDNTTSISVISFSPLSEDHNARIKCQAINPKIDQIGLEDSFKLNIVYAPVVSLKFGLALNLDDIKENDDVYFECKHHENPPAFKILWYRNDFPVSQQISSGIIISSSSLVIQSVKRQHSGLYKCEVINAKGETTSNEIKMRVKYAPFCAITETKVLGTSLGEIVNVECSVMADPANVTFNWVFNNSDENFVVPKDKHVLLNATVSKLEYKLTSNRDYGTLSCWARNSAGMQRKPCTYFVVGAARPNPVTNCTLLPTDKDGVHKLEIQCAPGYNGGLTQTFHLEAKQQNKSLANSSANESPVFTIDLSKFVEEWQSDLQFLIYASNIKGQSAPTVLEHSLPKDLQTKMELTMAERNKHRKEYIAFSLIIVFFLALAISASFFVVLLIKKWCSLRRTANTSVDTKCNGKSNSTSEEKFLISYQIRCNQPDILNKVTEGSKLNLHRCEDTQTFSLHSPFDVTTKNKAPSENTIQVSPCQLRHEPSLPDDKMSLCVTTTYDGARNENKVTCKKIDSISNTSLSDAIFGPESAV